VILCWGRTHCQAVDIDSQWMELEVGGITGVSNLFLMNSKQCHSHGLSVLSPPSVKALGGQTGMGVDLSQFHLELFGVLCELV